MDNKNQLVRVDSAYLDFASIEDTKKEIINEIIKLAPEMAKRKKQIGSLGRALGDGNYFDLFIRARDNYIRGWFSSTLVLSRIVAEQVCIKLLEDTGYEERKWQNKNKNRQKTLEPLINACSSKALQLLNKPQAGDLKDINNWSGDIIHIKGQLKSELKYKTNAFNSLKYLGDIMAEKFDFIKKTGITRGYRSVGQTKRL